MPAAREGYAGSDAGPPAACTHLATAMPRSQASKARARSAAGSRARHFGLRPRLDRLRARCFALRPELRSLARKAPRVAIGARRLACKASRLAVGAQSPCARSTLACAQGAERCTRGIVGCAWGDMKRERPRGVAGRAFAVPTPASRRCRSGRSSRHAARRGVTCPARTPRRA